MRDIIEIATDYDMIDVLYVIVSGENKGRLQIKFLTTTDIQTRINKANISGIKILEFDSEHYLEIYNDKIIIVSSCKLIMLGRQFISSMSRHVKSIDFGGVEVITDREMFERCECSILLSKSYVHSLTNNVCRLFIGSKCSVIDVSSITDTIEADNCFDGCDCDSIIANNCNLTIESCNNTFAMLKCRDMQLTNCMLKINCDLREAFKGVTINKIDISNSTIELNDYGRTEEILETGNEVEIVVANNIRVNNFDKLEEVFKHLHVKNVVTNIDKVKEMFARRV